MGEPADRGELQALVPEIAIEGDLCGACAALAVAGHEIGEFGLVAALATVREIR